MTKYDMNVLTKLFKCPLRNTNTIWISSELPVGQARYADIGVSV